MSMDIVYVISSILVEAKRGRLPSDGRPAVKLLDSEVVLHLEAEAEAG